jgi:Recombination endonuclease VII
MMKTMARPAEMCEHGVHGKKSCLTCRRAYSRDYGRTAKGKIHRRRWAAANRSKTHDSQRQSVYGLSPEAYADMLTQQGNRCAMPDCRTAEPGGRGSWHVDHDHETGAVRGLLCNRCNLCLGQYENSIKREAVFKQYLNAASAQTAIALR